MITVSDLQEKVQKVNGSRKNRILRPDDIARFVELVNAATPDQHTIRVYSSDGFVPNSYGYRAEISYLQAVRNSETGEFDCDADVAGAKRSYGLGPLVTINNRGI